MVFVSFVLGIGFCGFIALCGLLWCFGDWLVGWLSVFCVEIYFRFVC